MVEVAHVKDRPSVGWNINSAHSKFICSLLFKANRHHHAGQFSEQFFTLRSLRDHINHDLSKTNKKGLGEREEMDELEKEVDVATINLRKNLTRENKEKQCQSIRKYLQRVMDLLLRLGYLPKKESKTEVHL